MVRLTSPLLALLAKLAERTHYTTVASFYILLLITNINHATRHASLFSLQHHFYLLSGGQGGIGFAAAGASYEASRTNPLYYRGFILHTTPYNKYKSCNKVRFAFLLAASFLFVKWRTGWDSNPRYA